MLSSSKKIACEAPGCQVNLGSVSRARPVSFQTLKQVCKGYALPHPQLSHHCNLSKKQRGRIDMQRSTLSNLA